MRSAKTYSFCFSKEERSRTFMGMVYHLIFLFQSSRLLPPPYNHFRSLLQEQRVSFFNWGILGLLSTISVHHLHNLAYFFIVLGFTLGFILGFTQSFGVHIIVLVTINSSMNHLSHTIKICSSVI